MKLLHLSDLHIGKIVNRYSMIDEQKHVFEQIIEYIKTEQPNAVIIAGDVYDRAIPGVEAVGVFDDFLTALAREGVTVMIIAGNHDSPERMSFASRLLSEKKLFLYGSFDGTLHKLSLTDEYGEVHFWLLPFVKPLSVRAFFGESAPSKMAAPSEIAVPSEIAAQGEVPRLMCGIESYDDALAAILEGANIDYSCRNVLVSHQFYTKAGVTLERSESELNPVGGLDAIDAGLIGQFDYVALGHLHGAQPVGSRHIRYAGSPVKYSFSEWRHEKSVTMVVLNEKGSLDISALPLKPIHDMREIKGEIKKLMSDEIVSLADKEDYVRVILTDEEEIIDPIGKLRSVYPNIMCLDFDNARKHIDIGAIVSGAEKMEKLSPYELFNEFFLESQGSTMSDEQSEIVRELLLNAHSEDEA